MNIFAAAYHQDLKDFFQQTVPAGSQSDYLLLPNSLDYQDDVQSFIQSLKAHCHNKTRIVVVSFNFLWKPIINLATGLGLRRPDPREPNWLTNQDITNLFNLEDFEEITRGKRLLLPIKLGWLSKLINSFVAKLPLINHLCLINYQIFRPLPKPKEYSVSIIIPARNEAGNIKGLLNKIPLMGTESEVIFVEGHSTDNTYQAIAKEIKGHQPQRHQAYLFKQSGEGKADAVRLGFKKAHHDILMILDADLTVDPRELPKFYQSLAGGSGEFANGSRLVYPMKKQAMRTLNYFGNKIFSLAFTYLLNQPIKDTLCGTKALFRSDYQKISQNRKDFGDFDPFGDFDLLFGAAKLNLKIIEIPIRYKDRAYGTTNISRFSHGWLLLKMTLFAAKKLKFI